MLALRVILWCLAAFLLNGWLFNGNYSTMPWYGTVFLLGGAVLFGYLGWKCKPPGEPR